MGLPLVLGGLAAAQGIIRLFTGKAQENSLNRMVDATGITTANQNVIDNVSQAKLLNNARMPGAATEEQNILASQANANAAVQRNATDAGQALSVISGLTGATNDSFAKLSQEEEQSKLRTAGVLQGAIAAETQEKARVWEDKLRSLNMKLGIKTVAEQNKDTAIGDILGGLGSAAQGLKGIAGKGG